MATTRPRRGKPGGPGRVLPWSGANQRPSPPFSPTHSPSRLPNGPPANQGAFPPLAGANGSRSQDVFQDRIIQSLAGLTGTTVTLSTKTGQRFEGVVSSTTPEGEKPGVTLKDVKEVTKSGMPLKDSLFFPSSNIETWQSGPADVKVPNGDSFRTDTEISKTKLPRERELQAWRSPEDTPNVSMPLPSVHEGTGDDVTFGPGAGANAPWDQFAVNEQMFGVTTSFNEEYYTTKLDRSAPDFKEKERKAQRIASEIVGVPTVNPHMAEERGAVIDDSGVNEEDKYGAVVRGANAYIPPGARKHLQQNITTGTGPSGNPPFKQEVPKVAVNGPDGSTVSTPKEATPPTAKSASPAPSTSSVNKPPADPLPAFRDFVTNERQRLTQKKQALVKSEMDKRKAELIKFSQSFKLNKPIPDDLVPILAKDEGKQRQIREKASQDATSTSARAIGSLAALNASSSASRMPQVSGKVVAEPIRKPTLPANMSTKPSATSPPAVSSTTSTPVAKPAEPSKANGKPNISMFIQAIPPFKGNKTRSPAPQTNGTALNANIPTSPTTTANRLNANASSFRPNVKANAFTPGPTSSNPSAASASASASASPKPKAAESATTPNPFFGPRPLKKGLVNVKDDFNPFKHNKVVEASNITGMWPYNGKRYMHMFPPLPHPAPQPSTHMAPPGPPPVPHHVYEEGEQRVMYYNPWFGQPMVPSGFVQPPFMAYSPGMPPNGQPIYPASPMGQMPPAHYMPSATYPHPPSGTVPRPSMPTMPTTPTPMHAHPYYHQSPQLHSATPYPMMIPPGGPGGPPHPYEAGPAPPSMGGVGHA